jgi:spermidine synthase
MLRARPLRTLGTIGRAGVVMEQSAMDLLKPERLVFVYERLMLIAFALASDAKSALLLGLGGGAMSRHLAAYLPDCAVTLVDRDPAIIELARKFFYNKREVLRADAREVTSAAAHAFDVVLVDLYDADDDTIFGARFWQDCGKSLKPGGCIAINWANSSERKRLAERMAQVSTLLGGSFFAIERGHHPNIVQFVPTAPQCGPNETGKRFDAFARRTKLPREDRDVMQRCILSTRYPARGPGVKK